MNEYQVAWEKARREANLKDESVKAYGLLKDHEAVVLRYVTRYCPYTDGILGSDIEIVGCGSLAEAQDYLAEHDEHDSEVYYHLLRRETPEELKSYNLVGDEDIPF